MQGVVLELVDGHHIAVPGETEGHLGGVPQLDLTNPKKTIVTSFLPVPGGDMAVIKRTSKSSNWKM